MPASQRWRWPLLILICFWPSTAYGHAFGQRYELPLPLPIFLWAAGAIVFLSFIISAILFKNPPPGRQFRIIVTVKLGKLGQNSVALLVAVARGLSLTLFGLVVAAGLLGSQSPLENLAPTAIWVIGWIGITFLCALTTNVWPLINPWTTIYDVFTYLNKAAGPGSNIANYREYPAGLGAWPAVVLFWCFAWFEIILPTSEIPATLAWALIYYSGITLSGMVIYGRDTWSDNGEFLTIFFHLVSRLSPIELCASCIPSISSPALSRTASQPRSPEVRDPWTKQLKIAVRPFGYGLTTPNKPSHSIAAFTVLILTTVTFDGLLETLFRQELISSVLSEEKFVSALFIIKSIFGTVTIGIETILFFVFPFFILIILFITCCLVLLISYENLYDAALSSNSEKRPISLLVRYFGSIAPSLIPIAIGYHVAHYTSFFLVAGQLMIPLASDPMGMGWDIFATANYRIDLAIVSTRFVWYLALLSIVLGHIVAVVVAHKIAIRELKGAPLPISAQIPVALLMVAYTTLSLWILAQPIAEY